MAKLFLVRIEVSEYPSSLNDMTLIATQIATA